MPKETDADAGCDLASQPWRRWDGHVATLAATISLRRQRPGSASVAAHARLIILDTIGCAIAGRTAPELALLEAHAATREPGAFHFPQGPGLGLRPAMQVLAIGPTWHEACEGHAFAHGRPGIATLAALFPLALARGATLGALIDAFVVGYEVNARAGGWLRVRSGMHVDGNWPALGAAAAVGSLLGLDDAAMLHAVNSAACQLPTSLYLPIRTGRSVRNAYLAHSATLGLDAALQAQAGFDAPPDALAHYAEFHSQAVAQPMPAAEQDLLPEAYLKPFAAVRHVHYGAIAARRIRERAAGDTSRMTGIHLSVYEEATIYCGNPQPTTPLAAQFSLSFGIAAALRTGTIDALTYQAPAFDDAELRRLEQLVTISVDAALTRQAQRGATLTVHEGDSATLVEHVAYDDPALILSPAGVREKFLKNVAPTIPPDRAGAFCDALMDGPIDLAIQQVWSAL
ncbi:MAG: MmgE/PrpD family protein [Burkholderiaceae bacterium]